MSLPTNRATGGVVQSADINAIAAAVNSKAEATHTHAASDIASGTLAIARIPTGTTSSTVALGNHSHTPASIGAAPASHTHGAVDLSGVVKTVNGTSPDGAGNVVVAGGGGGGGTAHLGSAEIFASSVDGSQWSALVPPSRPMVAAGTGAADRLGLGLLHIPACTITQAAMNVTAAGGNLRFGIYAANPTTHAPGALLFDSGLIDATTTGLKTVTLGTPLALPSGPYWTVFGFSVDTGRADGWAQHLHGPLTPRKWRTPTGTAWESGLPASITVDPANSVTAFAAAILVKATL